MERSGGKTAKKHKNVKKISKLALNLEKINSCSH